MTDDIQKIKELIQKYHDIKWGYDGHCGSADIIEEIEEIVDRLIEN